MSEALRDNAIERVREANDSWVATAIRAGKKLSQEKDAWTTDDLWAELNTPREPRAMGAVIVHLKKHGYIQASGRYTQSTRPECHARPIMIWMST